MKQYTAKLHGKCPFHRGWDYYSLVIKTNEFMKCEDIEATCDIVRGATITQEAMAKQLRESFPSHCTFDLSGVHANVETIVSL